MSQPTVRGFFRQRIDDTRAASLYVRSLWGILLLSRRRRELQTELAGSHRQIGDAAEKARVGDELAAMQGVRDTRAALTAAQAEIERHQGELAGAEEQRRQQETRHNRIVEPIETDCGRLRQQASLAVSARTAAGEQVGQIERDIKRVEAMLSAAEQGRPSPQPVPLLQQQLADLRQTLGRARQNLAAATETRQQAAMAAQQKQAELDAAKEARKQALAACDQKIGRCRSAIKEAETIIGKCEVSLAAAHGELGKAVLEANLSGAGIDGCIGPARSLMQQMARVGEQSSQKQTQASVSRGGAIRSAATLAVVVLAVGLVWMLAAKLMRPGRSVVMGGTTQPALAATNNQTAASSIPSPSPVGPVKLKPEDLLPAILAMPSLAVRADESSQKNPLFKPTGTITCTDRRPIPGGNETFRFTVEVQSRPSAGVPLATGEMTVEVVVDEAGQVLSSRTTGYTDPDMLDILRNEDARPGQR